MLYRTTWPKVGAVQLTTIVRGDTPSDAVTFLGERGTELAVSKVISPAVPPPVGKPPPPVGKPPPPVGKPPPPVGKPPPPVGNPPPPVGKPPPPVGKPPMTR